MLRMRARTTPLRLTVGPLVPGLLRDVLTVGGLAAVGTSLSNITLALVTGAAGVFGAAAIAGYGIATRLDAVLIPILFGIGTGVVTMVGAALGAGNLARAREVALTGVTIGAALSGAAGLVLALAPGLWTGLFTSDPAVHEAAASYLQIAGPFYGFLGAGLMMFFAAQGARRIGWPVAFGIVRLTLAGLIGWWLVAAVGLPLWALSATIAASLFIYGTGTVVAVLSVPWSDKRSH
jgi:Na+-driven multidrug efflux pump